MTVMEPEGLRPIVISAREKRELLREKTLEGIQGLFPLIGKTHDLHLISAAVRPASYSSNDQKRAILEGRTLAEPVVGRLVLKDKAGAVVDTKDKHVLAHLPYFTERHTMIVGGNEYEVPNQLRLKPGVYTRERGNGEYEAAFNLSKGENFRLSMDPETGKMNAEFATTTAPLYPLLRALGVQDATVRQHWGADLLDANKKSAGKEEAVLNKLVARFRKPKDPQPTTLEGKRSFVQNYFDGTRMSAAVTERTLGKGYDRVTPDALLRASQKLLEVHKGTAEEDDRDSLEFKTIHSVEDFFKERLDKDARYSVNNKLIHKMNQAKTKEIKAFMPNAAYSRPLTSFLTSSAIAAIPTQFNPIELIDHAAKVTSLGEGGITADRAIPFEARKVHGTHYGILDIVRTPESGHAGIDLRAAMGAYRDAHGELYAHMQDARTGKAAPVRVTILAQSHVGFAGQGDKSAKMDALRGSNAVSVDRKKVDYVLADHTHQFSPATALVPFLNGMQMNRAIMGSKFQTQALPLLEREVPFIQAQAPRAGHSMEKEVARLTVPTSSVHGTVEKIDADYIYIRPDAKKHASVDDRTLLESVLGVWQEKTAQDLLFADDAVTDALEEKIAAELPLHVLQQAIEAVPPSRLGGMFPQLPFDGVWRRKTLHDIAAAEGVPAAVRAYRQAMRHVHGRGTDLPLVERLKGYKAYRASGGSLPRVIPQLGRVQKGEAATALAGDGDVVLHSYGPLEGLQRALKDPASPLDQPLFIPGRTAPQTEGLFFWEGDTAPVFTQSPRGLGDPGTPGKLTVTLPRSKVLQTGKHTEINPLGERVVPAEDFLRHARDIRIEPVSGTEKLGVSPQGALGKHASPGIEEPIEDEDSELEKFAAETEKGLIKLPYDTHFPLAAKTYLHNTVTAKVGDTVTPGQTLAESNFTRNGTMALGKNLSVAYLAYYGKNSNDAVVISEGAAKKLTSEHMYKEVLRKGPDTLQGKAKYMAYFGMRFTKAQLDKLDDQGVAKPGQHFSPGDPLILALEKAAPSPEAAMLGHLHKSLVKPYRDAAVIWEHHTDGEAIEAVNAARQVVVTVRTHEAMKVGDKLANRFGGKGVVSEIIPQHKMVQDESGKPIDVLFTSAGIISRINPAQVVEGALGKVVEKTGKPIVVPQFEDHNNVEYAKGLLKEHGLSDKETVYDPVSGRHIPKVFVGRSYILKLFKSGETNFAARGVTSYDVNLQPTKGGDEGAKGLGKMEINTLLAHNARNVLKDALTVKSEKSDEYWRALEFGLPPPAPKTPFVTQKFNAMLTGAGINVDKRGTVVGVHALIDTHVKGLSSGALTLPELEKSKSFMVTSKNLKPETGGLFDPVLTGGLSGARWSHIELPEASLSPVFEEPVRRLLGVTKAGLEKELMDKGGDALKKRLNKLDLEKLEKELEEKTRTARASALDDVVKQLKYVRALKSHGLKAGDAYFPTLVPVIPPIMRPILPSQRSGELQISDANYLYRDLALAAAGLKAAKETELPELVGSARKHMFEAHAALAGTREPTSPQLQGRGVKGFVTQVTGAGSPKSGFLFKKILKRQQDLSGRATATPDNTLDMDQIGVPEDMLWKTYDKFVMKGLIGQGYAATKAQEMVAERHPAARTVFDRELKERPVFVNRAPSLHKHNFVAAYPVAVSGTSFRVNPFIEKGMNLDFDGDAMQLHVPVSPKAVDEAKNLTLSKLLFTDKSRGDLIIFPQHEAIIGAYLATSQAPKGAVKKFKDKAAAMAAYKRGEITLETPIELG